MQFRKSLALSLIAFLLLIAGGTLFTGYFINISALHLSLESRERNKADYTHSIINAIIGEEARDIEITSNMLKNSPDLSSGLAYYVNSGGDISRLKKVMDRLYRDMEADIFVVTDTKGIVLYRANDPEKRGDSHREIWGMDETLKGKNITATSRGPRGWAIRALAPLYSGGKIHGVLITGVRIDDKFAKRLSGETQTQVSFATTEGVLASSQHPKLRANIDFDKIKQSMLEIGRAHV
jgi:sensor histidine kinase regulating citrate/malate metabolism